MPWMPPNATCDVYRAGHAPPAAPDVGAVPCYLKAIYPQGMQRGQGQAMNLHFTHSLLVDPTADIRDDYNANVIGPNADTIFIPDKTGTPWSVIFVEFVDLGTAWQHKRVYLSRQTATWPTQNL